ncbi:hypothetical protein OG698_07735 [Streptomyces sp. NBC_01003]|uniref:hypothetical protein n=1 Tax=unclassified Streptomyces TaxID=2593676 RepID=UPI0037D42865|nr:hypothetical protein OG698_07735 [Streptomyces sp. NBC_01003]
MTGEPASRTVLDDGQIRHLELIQAVVARMGNNSFLIKGWALTLMGALLAFAAGNESRTVAATGFVPIVAFWLLDGYFLYKERLFRRLYDKVRRPGSGIEPFSLDASAGAERAGALRAAGSLTVALFYGGLALAQLIALVVLF